jgi:membrane-associated phospholipid phosphatase
VNTGRVTSPTGPDTVLGRHGARADRRFGAHAVLAFAAVFIVAVPVGLIALAVRSADSWVVRLDLRISDDLHDYAVAHPAFSDFMRVVSDIGAAMWWVVLPPIVVWLYVTRRWRLGTFVVVTALGSPLLNRAIKEVVDRARPLFDAPVEQASGRSFPSGHTQAAVVGTALVLLVTLPYLRAALRAVAIAAGVVIVVIVGFSRLALGVHFLSDVVGGVLVGAAWVLAMVAAFSAWRNDLGQGREDLSDGLTEPPA